MKERTRQPDQQRANASSPPVGSGYRPEQLLVNTSFKDILDFAEAAWSRRLAETRADVERRCAALRHIKNLRPFWETRTVGQYMKSKKQFLAERTAKGSHWTANREIGALSTATNVFANDRGLIGKINFGVEEAPHAPVDWLERDEVARLLRAARDRHRCALSNLPPSPRSGQSPLVPRLEWYPGTKRWASCLQRPTRAAGEAAPAELVAPRSHVDWIGRLLLLLVYTGSTVRCVFRLRWNGTPDCGWSYVDLDTEIEGRIGHLYRLGPDTASRNMAGLPVALSRRLVAHLRRWRDIDAQHGYTHVLHRSPYIPKSNRHGPPDRETSYDPVALREVWVRAGRFDNLDLARLSCTAVVWVLRSGKRKRKGVKPFKPSHGIMRSAAFMIGKRYDEFVDRFRGVMPDFHKKQTKALSAPARTVG